MGKIIRWGILIRNVSIDYSILGQMDWSHYRRKLSEYEKKKIVHVVPEKEYERLQASTLWAESIFSGYRRACANKYHDPNFLKCVNEQEVQELIDFHEGNSEYEEYEPSKPVPSGRVTMKRAGENETEYESEDAEQFVKHVYRNATEEQKKQLLKKVLMSGDKILRAESQPPRIRSPTERYILFNGAVVPSEVLIEASKKGNDKKMEKLLADIERGVYD